MAAAYLQHVYGEAMEELDLHFLRRLDRRVWRVMRQMLAGGVNSPLTSSAGRLFDAVAALVGLCDEVQYEAQAAIELEMAADGTPEEGYPFHIRSGTKPMVVETTGIIKGVVEDLTKGRTRFAGIAAKFHTTLGEIICEVCCRIRGLTGLEQAALSGGVFQNIRLLSRRGRGSARPRIRSLHAPPGAAQRRRCLAWGKRRWPMPSWRMGAEEAHKRCA